MNTQSLTNNRRLVMKYREKKHRPEKKSNRRQKNLNGLQTCPAGVKKPSMVLRISMNNVLYIAELSSWPIKSLMITRI